MYKKLSDEEKQRQDDELDRMLAEDGAAFDRAEAAGHYSTAIYLELK
jgi:hypothetical protein